MDLDFSEEQTLLRSTVHRLCEEQVDTRHVRAMEADAAGFSPVFWGALGELGLCGMLAQQQPRGHERLVLPPATEDDIVAARIKPLQSRKYISMAEEATR